MVASERSLPIYRAQRLDGHFDDGGGGGGVRLTYFPKKKTLIVIVERKKTSLTFLFFTFSLFT